MQVKKNPIRKMHVGWSHSWTGGINSTPPKSVSEWVAICPRCKVPVRSKPYGVYHSTKNTRKSAKDALRHHMIVFH